MALKAVGPFSIDVYVLRDNFLKENFKTSQNGQLTHDPVTKTDSKESHCLIEVWGDNTFFSLRLIATTV